MGTFRQAAHGAVQDLHLCSGVRLLQAFLTCRLYGYIQLHIRIYAAACRNLLDLARVTLTPSTRRR